MVDYIIDEPAHRAPPLPMPAYRIFGKGAQRAKAREAKRQEQITALLGPIQQPASSRQVRRAQARIATKRANGRLLSIRLMEALEVARKGEAQSQSQRTA